MNFLKTRNLLLPLTVLGFVGVAVTFLSPVFTTSTRWAIMLLLLLYLLIKGQVWRPLRTRFGMLTLLFGALSLLTTLWSEQPLLSLMKAAAFLLVAVACLAGGYQWARQQPLDKTFDYLLPLMAVALLAGILGRFSTEALVISGTTVMYQGLVSGSNMFGSMLAMCMPLLFWKMQIHRGKRRAFVVWTLLALIALYYLFMASSRAAILIMICTWFGFSFSFHLARRLQVLLVAGMLALNAVMVVPGLFERIQEQYIYKNANVDRGLFYTREEVWKISYEQAVKGGWFGGGYGVTIGGSNTFSGGLTSFGYGREKGNSQLAIVEETGKAGFVIYLLSLVVLFRKLARTVARTPDRRHRAVLWLVIGALGGMLVGSVFEAWWVAPGSPESIHFWVLAGVGLGLCAHPALQGAGQRSADARRQVQGRPAGISGHGTYP